MSTEKERLKWAAARPPAAKTVLALPCCALALLVGSVWISAAAEAEDLQVNVTNGWDDGGAAIAMNAAGKSVIVWESQQAHGDLIGSIQGRLYGSDGAQLGEQFRINTDTEELEVSPTVAMNAAGEFVVAWCRLIVGGFEGQAVEYQRFATDGTKVGDQVMANYDQDEWASNPALAMDDDGNFVIVWNETRNLHDYRISARRFDAKTGQLGALIYISSSAASLLGHWAPKVALTATGKSFVVVWEGSNPNAPNGAEILARRFAADGSPLGEHFQVNTSETGEQSAPAVASDAAGNFVMAWESESSSGSDGSGWSVQARRFASDGSAAGPEMQVNTYTMDTSACRTWPCRQPANSSWCGTASAHRRRERRQNATSCSDSCLMGASRVKLSK